MPFERCDAGSHDIYDVLRVRFKIGRHDKDNVSVSSMTSEHTLSSIVQNYNKLSDHPPTLLMQIAVVADKATPFIQAQCAESLSLQDFEQSMMLQRP